jgi:hypothetical protein
VAEPDDLERSELEAVIETRRVLGPTYEPALVDSFVEKVELAILQRVDVRLAARQRSQALERRHSAQQLALTAGVRSCGTGYIPASDPAPEEQP